MFPLTADPPGVLENVVPVPELGDQPVGVVQLKVIPETAFTARVCDEFRHTSLPLASLRTGVAGISFTVIAMVRGVSPTQPLAVGVTVILPLIAEAPGVVAKLVPVPELGDQPVGVVQAKLTSETELIVMVCA